MRRPLRLLVLAATLAACAARTPTMKREPPLAARVEAPGLLFELIYTQPDGAELPRIGSGLLAASARLSRWGTFRHGVYVRVYPDHASLEEALDKRGYPWLRAWALGDQVLLQSPRSWNAPGDLSELLVHELTHALMYQLIEPPDPLGPAALLEEPPLWFSEGMASVTADQGRHRMSSEELTRWQREHPGRELLHPDAELYRTEKEAVYGAAHRTFDLLLRLTGDEAIRELLRRVREGAAFPVAFQAATGRELSAFERDAVHTAFGGVGGATASSGSGGL